MNTKETVIIEGMKVQDIRTIAFPACRAFNVRRLDVFGSIARGSATSSSDVDLLVEFADPTRSPAKRFFGLLHQLEDSLGCEVDLLTLDSLRNPYFKSQVLREKIPIYED
jgi:predicted nucleotidyltransferase